MSKDRNPEELAQIIDDLFQTSTLPLTDDSDDPLVEVALELAHDKPPQLNADMRARMLEKVQQSIPPKSQPKQVLSFPTEVVLRWVAVFAVFVILLNNVAIPAMADSLPGDFLYPTKLRIESIELGLAASDVDRADIYILQAQRRLDEADRLLDSNVVNEQLIIKAIENIRSANELNPTPQSELVSSLTEIELSIERIREKQPSVANNLSQKAIEILPTVEPTRELLLENTQNPELTMTPTVTASLTMTPSFTPSPTLTSTRTPSPTLTQTPSPTATSTRDPSPTFTDEPTITPAYEAYVGVISATSNVNIRELPTVESAVIQQVLPGTIVTIIGESIDGQWLNIDIQDGKQGWIANSLIVKGTVPLFTLATQEVLDMPSIETSTIPQDTTSTTSDTTTDSSSSNQGNDGINNFGCDGQGNSCNAGSQGNNNGNGNNGNNGNNNNNGSNKNNGNNGNNGNKNK